MMESNGKISRSIFDDIFLLNSTVPVHEADPEDSNDLSATLTENIHETQDVSASKLRRQSTVIPNDPKFKGQKTSRKNLYSDEVDLFDVEANEGGSDVTSDIESEQDKDSEENMSDEDDEDEQNESEEYDDDEIDDDDDESISEETQPKKFHKDKTVVLAPDEGEDYDKGKTVCHQLAVWDDLMKSRIALQKLVTLCNRVPQPDVWPQFIKDEQFRAESDKAHISVRSLTNELLELQRLISTPKLKDPNSQNSILQKWDEKTKLAHGKVKSKNFAAFDVSVLKQIEQILSNKDRLVRRIHQQRSDYTVIGKKKDEKTPSDLEEKEDLGDSDDDIQMTAKPKNELVVDQEIIDDNDFYHVLLRDLIETKQSEETDPVTTNRHWIEIQRLRNKQKRKVDTRASKGRKIRYNVKEKLKNFMTPYDKSLWTKEQKDDLFKALFGGNDQQTQHQPTDKKSPFTINLGL